MIHTGKAPIGTAWLAAALSLAVLASADSAAASDGPLSDDIPFEAITYGGQIGCGLYVELFLDGQLAMDDQGRSGSFILGSPPDLTVEQCLARCEEGLSSSFVEFLKAAMPADEATGWCFQGRDVIAGPYDDLPQESTDAACSDGIDNDGDELTDCADTSCSQDESVVVCPEPGALAQAMGALLGLAILARRASRPGSSVPEGRGSLSAAGPLARRKPRSPGGR